MRRRVFLGLAAGTAWTRDQGPRYGPPEEMAVLADTAVNESSGVAASRRHPGVYWTHNDSGDAPRVFAFDSGGRALGRWLLTGAHNVDWEDIATGPGPRPGTPYLYVGDIGDNSRVRQSITVYRIEEPAVLAGACLRECRTPPAEAFRFEYPRGGPFDAETLLVHPRTGGLYIVTKAMGEHETTTVYKAPAPLTAGRTVRLLQVAQLDIPERTFVSLIGGITGGAISPDGARVALCDYFRAYEAVLPAGAPFDAVWKREFHGIPLGLAGQHEGICYSADGRALIITAEGRPCRVVRLNRLSLP